MRVLRRLYYLLRQRRFDRDLAAEMAFHREMLERDLAAGSPNPGHTATSASRAFGSAMLARDRARDVWIPHALQGLGQDLRLAVRTLWRTRVVTIVAVVSLALGIGANTAMFSLLDAVVLRPLPVRDPGTLTALVEPAQFAGVPMFNGYAVWDQIRQRSSLFGGAAAWWPGTLDRGRTPDTQPVDVLLASGGFFDVLGVPASLGRTFSLDDDASVPGHAGAAPVAVISDEYWRRAFGGTPDVLGRTITLDRVPFTIVGVAAHGFFGPEPGRTFDVAVPLGNEPLLHPRESWLTPGAQFGGGAFRILVRLAPRQTVEAATAALRAVQPQIRQATMPANWPARYRGEYLKTPFTLARVDDARWNVRRFFEQPLVAMLAIVMLVLLVACGNIASLLLARARARRAELSIRLALGASRWRLVRQLLAESLLLAGAGGAAGLGIAAAAARLLVRQASTDASPLAVDASLDARVLLFTLALAGATVLLFGLMPAWRAARAIDTDGLLDRSRQTGGGRDRLSAALVVAQVALSLALVVAAGLLGRTFASLEARPLGFEASRVALVHLSSEHADIAPGDRDATYERIRQAVRGLPGVADAAISFQTPIVSGPMLMQPIEAVSDGPPLPPIARGPHSLAALNIVSPDWFDSLGVAMRAGRGLSDRDAANAPLVAVVNEAFARRFLNGGNPVGHTARLALPGPPRPPTLIVGLAADAVYGTLRSPVPPAIYLPIAQLGNLGVPFLKDAYLIVRSRHDPPAAMVRPIAAAITSLAPDIGFTFRTLDEQIADSLSRERLLALVSASVGVLALLLAALGLYGVAAYAVERRQREFGVRLALGATAATVLRLVLQRVGALVLAGLVLGAVASLWAARLLGALLYHVAPRDPITLGAAAMVLALVAAIATAIPAFRAARIDPAVTLRCE
jgi:predicted permease